MRTWSICAAVSVLACLPRASPANEPAVCLTKEQRRVEVIARHVVPLGVALRAAHGRRSELLDARLCRDGKGLFYLLTLLPRDGKVRRATVDAGTGKLAEGR